MKKNIAVFLDRDGTINEEVGYLDREEKLKILPAAFEAVRLVNQNGFKVVVVSNQSGIARGLFTEDFVRTINNRIAATMVENGAVIDRFYYCPHHPSEGLDPYRKICNCRKPEPGLLLQAAADLNLDLSGSYMIGDHLRDIETARRAGAKGILVMTGHGPDQLQSAEITSANRPDDIAPDILEAVRWILRDKS